MNCKNFNNCPVTPTLLGYDATVLDVPMFIGLGFGPNTPPPLNWQFSRPTAFAIVDSPISQTAADNLAYESAVYQAQSGWVNPDGSPPIGWGDPVNDQPSDYFGGQVGGISTPPLV